MSKIRMKKMMYNEICKNLSSDGKFKNKFNEKSKLIYYSKR